MPAVRRLTVVEQTAAHLFKAIKAGRWRKELPGVRRLAAELGVSRDSISAALKVLENEGNLTPQGPGRNRQISERIQRPKRALRVGILLHLPMDKQNAEMQRTLTELRHDIDKAGHVWVPANNAHWKLDGHPERIAKVVAEATADAWIVVAGSRGLLEWFAQQAAPTIAFGGASAGLPLASSMIDAVPAMQAAVRQLTALGHRRIALISPSSWKTPPSRLQQAFLEELVNQGIPAGEYNAPAWEENAAGLQKLLHSLFRVTAPTALLVVEPPRTLAVLHFLNQRALRIPQDVSLVCFGQDSMFEWSDPPFAHIRYDLALPRKRIIKWIDAVSRGASDRSFRTFPAEFVPGGSIGPVSKRGA